MWSPYGYDSDIRIHGWQDGKIYTSSYIKGGLHFYYVLNRLKGFGINPPHLPFLF